MLYSKMKSGFITFSMILAASASTLIGCTKTSDDTTAPPAGDPATVTDVDGNVYKTVRIGTQLWITENLRTTRYNDSTAISTGLSNGDWGSASMGAYSVYDGDANNNATYGKLYNWHAVMTGKLAPKGWHVPSESEWQTMIEYLGGSSVAGGKLKSTSSLWMAPNTGATNSSGFSGLPSGYRGSTGAYSLITKSAYFWAATQRNTTQGEYFLLDNDFASSNANGATKTFGYAVRCIMNY